jgi:hypothetical protein
MNMSYLLDGLERRFRSGEVVSIKNEFIRAVCEAMTERGLNVGAKKINSHNKKQLLCIMPEVIPSEPSKKKPVKKPVKKPIKKSIKKKG